MSFPASSFDTLLTHDRGSVSPGPCGDAPPSERGRGCTGLPPRTARIRSQILGSEAIGTPRDHRVPSSCGEAEQPDGQAIGQQVFLRLSKAALDTFRGGLLAASDPQGSEAEGAQAHPAPNPYQALGLVGR